MNNDTTKRKEVDEEGDGIEGKDNDQMEDTLGKKKNEKGNVNNYNGDEDNDDDGITSTHDILKVNIPNLEEIMSRCEQKARELLFASWENTSNAIESIHNKENENKNHIRLHYDNKLSTCRVSYLLQNRHKSKLLTLKKLESEEEIRKMYQSKINMMDIMFQQSQDVVRIQEKTVIECQDRANRMEKELEETQLEFETFKDNMTEKYNKIEEDLNRKTKQEVWAHFKIVYLKKKLKKTERLLQIKKMQNKGLTTNIRDLTERLTVSLKIRNRMEKSFEKRANIRGRMDILNQEILCEKNGRTNSRSSGQYQQNKQSRQRMEKQCQTECQRIEVKHQAVDSSPFFEEAMKAIHFQLAEVESKLAQDTTKYEVATRQNEAYKRLISGKNIALILASEHRNLFAKPNSLEAQLLYDLTSPQGVLVERKPSCRKDIVDIKSISKRKIESPDGQTRTNSIPTPNTIVDFEGIKGCVYSNSVS